MKCITKILAILAVVGLIKRVLKKDSNELRIKNRSFNDVVVDARKLDGNKTKFMESLREVKSSNIDTLPASEIPSGDLFI